MSSLSQVLSDNALRPINYVKVKDEYFKVDRDLESMLKDYETCIARADRSRKKTYTVCGIGGSGFFASLICSCYWSSAWIDGGMTGSVLLTLGPGTASHDDTIQWHSQANAMARSCIQTIRKHQLESVPEAQIAPRTRVVEILDQHYKCWDWIGPKIINRRPDESAPLAPDSPLSQMTRELNFE